MRKIPEKLKLQLKNDPFYKRCIRAEEDSCKGRITWEHAFTYAGRQINERWSIVPLCSFHHGVDEYLDGGDFIKERGQLTAIRRATDQELEKYPKKDWKNLRSHLESKDDF